MERRTFIDAKVIGTVVRVASQGEGWASTSSGTYLGVALDEEDGVPYHYFINGEINGHTQRCFGFPATAGAEVTTEKTPTQLITEALGESATTREP